MCHLRASRNVALLHLHADVCTKVGPLPTAQNADTLCSRVKRKGLSMIPHDLNRNKVKKMLSSVEFNTKQHNPQSHYLHLKTGFFFFLSRKSLVYPFSVTPDQGL